MIPAAYRIVNLETHAVAVCRSYPDALAICRAAAAALAEPLGLRLAEAFGEAGLVVHGRAPGTGRATPLFRVSALAADAGGEPTGSLPVAA